MHPFAYLAQQQQAGHLGGAPTGLRPVGNLGAPDEAARAQLLAQASQVAQQLASQKIGKDGADILGATVTAFSGGMKAGDVNALAQQLGGAAGMAACVATQVGAAAAPICGAAGALAGGIIGSFFGGGGKSEASPNTDDLFESSLFNRKNRLETELLPKLSGTDGFVELQKLLDGYFDVGYSGSAPSGSPLPWDRTKFGGFFVFSSHRTWNAISKDDKLKQDPWDYIKFVRRALGGLYATGAITQDDAKAYGDIFEKKIGLGTYNDFYGLGNLMLNLNQLISGEDPETKMFSGKGLLEENFQRAVQGIFARAEMTRARDLAERLDAMQAGVAKELRCNGDAACEQKARATVAAMVAPGNTPEDTKRALDTAVASPTARSGLSTGAKAGLLLAGVAGGAGLWWANRKGYLEPVKKVFR